MSLIKQWRQEQAYLEGKHVRQIIGIAGDGKLRDGNPTSVEFREFIKYVSPDLLARYCHECLDEAFQDSGLVLQDLVNEVGRRIGFSVTDGRYRGTKRDIGHDGLWLLSDQRALVVEIKTTDAYRINLDAVAGYLSELQQAGTLKPKQGAVLIVVGRHDTGDLEAQVRGSRHAWDMRIISISALVKLMLLKKTLEDPVAIRRIHDVLFPREFTRLDAIIDLAFETVSDARAELEEPPESEQPTQTEHSLTDTSDKKFTPVAFNEACAAFVQKRKEWVLVKQSRASYVTPEGATMVLCLVSKQHDRGNAPYYWFAFHKHQLEALSGYAESYVAFGCGAPDKVVLIPHTQLAEWTAKMNRTTTDDRDYWHIQIIEDQGHFALIRKANVPRIDLDGYLLTP